MNLNRAWVMITMVTIVALDILYNMQLSYVSSALPVFIFTLYTLNKEGRKQNDEKKDETKDKNEETDSDEKKKKCKSCTFCMKSIKKCICAFGNWE